MLPVVHTKLIVFGFLLGTILGSLVKALADRNLTGKKFSGRSYCPHCKHKLQWYDLFPIVSYIILSGKCRYCGDKIGVEYLLVEVVMGVVIGFLFWSFVAWDKLFIFLPDLIFQTFFITILAVLFLTDIKKMLIPDRIILPAIVVTVIFLLATTLYKIGYLYYYLSQSRIGQLLLPPYSDYFRRHAIITVEPLMYSVLSALLIGGFFWLLILVTKGKGMGGGDVKLGAFMGLGLGFPNAFVALILAFFTGAIWGLGAIVLKKKRFGQHIAFGPFLILGSIIALFWGQKILDWYLKLGAS